MRGAGSVTLPVAIRSVGVGAEALQRDRQFLARLPQRAGRCARQAARRRGRIARKPRTGSGRRSHSRTARARSRSARPDPDAQHVAAVEADRPGVAVAVGCAGLIGDAALGGAVRRPDAGQYVGDLPRRAPVRVQPWRAAVGGGRFGAVAQRLRLAAIGKASVELHEVAQRTGRRRRARWRGRALRCAAGPGVTPAWRKRVESRAGPDRVEQAHRRHVERQLQRLADGHVALVAHVEILRPVAGEIGRPVLDQRLLRDQALFQGEPVDEGLQRRARRAHVLVMSIQPERLASK